MNSFTISNGVEMPSIGIGTYQMSDPVVLHQILDVGLQTGYRLIDTAAVYKNENYIGESLKILLPKYNLRREEIFIISKLSTKDHGSGKAFKAGLQSLKNLQLDYIDVYLIHFPGVSGMKSDDPRLKRLRQESWTDLERLQREGKFRSIGVSNYTQSHLEELLSHSSIPPVLNQCEYHPHLDQRDLVNYCRQKGIHFQAYSSLGSRDHTAKLFSEPLLQKLAKKHCCTVAQLLLAWPLHQGISVLPKTTNVDHLKSNFKATDISLSQEEIDQISNLSTMTHYCWNPSVVL